MLALLMLALEYRQCLCLALLFIGQTLIKYLTTSILEDHSSTTHHRLPFLLSSSVTLLINVNLFISVIRIKLITSSTTL